MIDEEECGLKARDHDPCLWRSRRRTNSQTCKTVPLNMSDHGVYGRSCFQGCADGNDDQLDSSADAFPVKRDFWFPLPFFGFVIGPCDFLSRHPD